jgi:hypothetical protein
MAKRTIQTNAAAGKKKSPGGFVALGVAFLTLLGIAIQYGPSLGAFIVSLTKPGSNVELEIKYPSNGSLVSQQEAISGVARNTPADHEIWVVIYSYPDEVYYPYAKNVEPEVGGGWKSPETNIGAASDSGQYFDVICLLADEDAQQEFRRYAESAESSGMKTLPKGAKKYHQVKVKRR